MTQTTTLPLALSLTCALAACAPTPESAGPDPGAPAPRAAAQSGSAAGTATRTLSFTRIVDLSHTIAPNIPLWPGDPAVEFQTVASFEEDGYYLRKFTIGEHSATHMNAPNSFHPGGIGIDAYAPESLVVPAVVIDVRAQAAADPDYALTKTDLFAWEAQHGEVPAGSVVLLYTGWQAKWGDPIAFFNQDTAGNLHFPGFAGPTTRFLLDHRGIAGVGIDTHGADPGLDERYQTNSQVLAQNGIVLECLTGLDQLPATGANLVLGILRLQEGSGTPLSVMAFVP